jgi:hypothetical protein
MRDARPLQFVDTGPAVLCGGQPISSSDYISLRERNKRRRATRKALFVFMCMAFAAYGVYLVRTL